MVPIKLSKRDMKKNELYDMIKEIYETRHQHTVLSEKKGGNTILRGRDFGEGR